MNEYDTNGIDPTLEACCQQEVRIFPYHTNLPAMTLSLSHTHTTCDLFCLSREQMEQNRRQTAITTTLRRFDRIALAERRRRHVISNLTFGDGCQCCYDAEKDGGEYYALEELRKKLERGQQAEVEEPSEKECKEDDSQSDSDSEFDYLLDEDLPDDKDNSNDVINGPDSNLYMVQNTYQQDRILELQLDILINESALQHGFGTHRQFHPLRILHAAGLGLESLSRSRAATITPAVVLHLFDAESDLSASLDMCLEGLTTTYRGTKFMRSEGKATLWMNRDLVSKELPSLNVDRDIPALVAIRDGVVISTCPKLSALGSERDGTIEPRAVEDWLDNARVLLRNVPIEFEDFCRIRPEEDALLENMRRERSRMQAVKEEDFYCCGVKGCRKSFFHEHVGIQNDAQSGLVINPDDILEAKG